MKSQDKKIYKKYTCKEKQTEISIKSMSARRRYSFYFSLFFEFLIFDLEIGTEHEFQK